MTTTTTTTTATTPTTTQAILALTNTIPIFNSWFDFSETSASALTASSPSGAVHQKESLKDLRSLKDHRGGGRANSATNQAAAAATDAAMTRKAESLVGLDEFLQRLDEDSKKQKQETAMEIRYLKQGMARLEQNEELMRLEIERLHSILHSLNYYNYTQQYSYNSNA
jgi:hypothetical protein